MGTNRREEFEWDTSISDDPFDENLMTEEEKEEVGEPQGPEKKPCPDCGKSLTWLADGSRPRAHKCVDKEEPQQTEEAPAKPQGVTADMVIAKYVESRDEIAALKKDFEEKKREIDELQSKRARWLMGRLDEVGGESLKTKAGTVFIDYKESAKVSERETFFKWVGEDFEERSQFLNSAVNKTAVKQRLEDGETAPPGTDFVRIKDIKVRRI